MRSRIVITGLGPVSTTGVGIDAFWESLNQNSSSFAPVQAFDASGYRPKLAGEVDDVKVRDYVPKSYRKATKVMARDTELAVISAKLAAQNAGLQTRADDPASPSDSDTSSLFPINPARSGCQIGAGLIAADTQELTRAVVTAKDENDVFSMQRWGTENEGLSGMNNLPPLWLLKYLPNMLACHVTIIHGLEGPSNTIMGAEASALLSIGEAARVIERGDADLCFAGGAESRINPLGFLRWDYTGRLAHTDDQVDPNEITKPYDPSSLGGVLGEAGGIVILEEEQHAKNRDARIYAILEGFGAGQTPPQLDKESPKPTLDRGLAASINNALQDAQVHPDEIDLILPLALGVPELDQLEIESLRSVFDDRLEKIPYLPLTRSVGNTIAAHGGLQIAAAAQCLKDQKLPNRACYFSESYNHLQSTQTNAIKRVLICSGSLGGQSAAIVLKRFD